MKYNKLVRDKIPEIIREKGEECQYHRADNNEYKKALFAKVLEELQEFQEDESIEEFADLMEVLDAVAQYKGFTKEEIAEVKNRKLGNKGGFDERIVLDEA